MHKTPILYGVIVGIASFILFTSQRVPVTPFPALFILFAYRLSPPKALWASFTLALFVDLLNSESRCLGSYPLIFLSTQVVALSQKKNFFEDKLGATLSFTAVISFCFFLFSLWKAPWEIRATPLFFDFFIQIVAGTLYPLLFMIIPLESWKELKEIPWKTLLKKKEKRKNNPKAGKA